jgi:hypothetical protein
VFDSSIPSGVAGLFFYNDEPNVTVGFDEFTIATFDPPVITPTPTPVVNVGPTLAATVVPNATVAIKPGVYVNSLRFTPAAPKYRQPITFIASFTNTTDRPQHYTWLVEIWKADTNDAQPFGQGDALDREIPVGTNERLTGDSFRLTGGGPCLPFRARVVYVDDQGRRVPFLRTNGTELWVTFQVCP